MAVPKRMAGAAIPILTVRRPQRAGDTRRLKARKSIVATSLVRPQGRRIEACADCCEGISGELRRELRVSRQALHIRGLPLAREQMFTFRARLAVTWITVSSDDDVP